MVQQEAAKILDRSVCLTLRCSYLGNHRKVDLSQLIQGDAEPGVDTSQFNTTKKLINSKELRPVIGVQDEAKAFLRKRAIPANRVFGERTYLVPITQVTEIHQRLVDFKLELLTAAAALASRYQLAVDRQKLLLGKMFNEKDYRTPFEVSQAFNLEWYFVSFAAPDRLETVDRALFEESQARYQQQMSDAFDDVRLTLRTALRQIMVSLTDKLTPASDGERKIFRDSVTKNLHEFLDTFSARNIADDDDLGRVVERLKARLDGVEPSDLRDSEDLRSEILALAKQTTVQLDGLVEEVSSRAMVFAE